MQENIVNSFGAAQLLVTGVQITSQSDIQVHYPACINYGLAEGTIRFSGGQIQPWTPDSYIGTNLTVHANSIFSLYFRCDHIVWSGGVGSWPDVSLPAALTRTVQTLVIPGHAESGVAFIAPATGTYRLTIEGGAYSPWPNDAYPGNQGWLTKLFIYKNRAISWGSQDSGLVGPIDPDVSLGMGAPTHNMLEAEEAGKGMSVTVEMKAHDKLIFVPIDEKGAYDSPANNRGEMRLSASLLSVPFWSEDRW